VSRRSLLLIALLVAALPLAAQTAAPEQQEPAPQGGLQAPPPAIQLLPLDTTPPDKLEEQGDNLRARNMLLDAIDSYRAAIAKKPSAVLYNKLGITDILLRRTNDALTAINRAIHMQRGYADAWNNRGSVYYLEGNYRRAAKDFEHAIKLNNQSASFHCNLGSAYFNERQLDKASREYQIALKLDPGVFERSSKSGIAALMGKPGDHAQFEYLMAKLYAETGDMPETLLHLRKALEEGYKDINNVYKDQEFATVRTDQRFKDLMAQKPESIPQ